MEVSEETIQASSTDELMAQLSSEHPFLKEITYTLFLNQELVRENKPLKESDVVVLCPPFAGG